MISTKATYNFDHQVFDYRILVGAVRDLHAALATPWGGFATAARQWNPQPL